MVYSPGYAAMARLGFTVESLGKAAPHIGAWIFHMDSHYAGPQSRLTRLAGFEDRGLWKTTPS